MDYIIWKAPWILLLAYEEKYGEKPRNIVIHRDGQLYVGSTQKMRLPITAGYADKICKNLGYVPEGKVYHMAISYKGLWKILIDRNMQKKT